MNSTNKIIFEKPDINALNKNYTVVDMHFHSRYSDGNDNVKSIARFASKLGIGLAITDHNTIKGAVEINNYKNILTIPGIEVTSKEGSHILIYFYRLEKLKIFYHKDIEPFLGNNLMSSILLTMEEIIKRARRYDALIIFPHPYCAVYTGVCNPYFPQERLNKLFDTVDGVEVLNGGNLNKWNLQCSLLGFNLNKAITGGSDGHTLKYLGGVITYAKCAKNRKAFLDAIKKGQNKVVGKEIAMLHKFTSGGLKLKSNIKNYPDYVEKNFKYSYTVINQKSKKLKDSVKRGIKERGSYIKKRRQKSF